MLNYVFKRLLLLIPVLFAVTALVFFLIHLIPGDPVDLILGEQALGADREALRAALRLDQPLNVQFFEFYHRLFRGDLGSSLFEHRPVLGLILERYPATLELTAAAMLVALTLALPLGVLAAWKKGSGWDALTLVGALVGISLPSFCLGPLLVLLFSVKWDVLPLSGRESWLGLVLPALSLGLAMAAILTRMTRASVLENLGEDYVRTARAKGVSERRVLFRHVLKNALNPIVTLAGLQFGVLLTGAIVTEKIFAWPGLGSLLLQSIQRRDYPVVQACILFIAVTYVLVNLATDLLYAKLDPRVELK